MKLFLIMMLIFSSSCFANGIANSTGNSGYHSADSTEESSDSSQGTSRASDSNAMRNIKMRNEVTKFYATKRMSLSLKREIKKTIAEFTKEVKGKSSQKQLEQQAIRVIAKKCKM
jgi:hypothetical protein